MSSLIVLCPHCLTWIEAHAQPCFECGTAINTEDPDPAEHVLEERLGERLRELGSVRLLRRGWPARGDWLATTEGLLFVPHLVQHANGSLEAVADGTPANSDRVAGLFHWWSLPPWRRPVGAESAGHEVPPNAGQPIENRQPARPLDLLLDSPGAFFIQRTSIQSLGVRWGRIQIERRPSRSVAVTQVPGGCSPREALRSLIDFPGWRTIVAEL